MQRQPIVHLSADAGFERLRGRLDRKPTRRLGVPRRAAWAAAAAVAISALGWFLAVTLLRSEPSIAPRFGTLTEGAAGRALAEGADGSMLIDVIFADGVREAEMRALLDELEGEIVAGPSRTLGRYTLRVAPAAGPLANGAPTSDAPTADGSTFATSQGAVSPGDAQQSDGPPSGASMAVDAVVQRLLDDPRIRFAGPTFSLPAVMPDRADHDQ